MYVRTVGRTDTRRAGSRTAGQLDGCTDGEHTEGGSDVRIVGRADAIADCKQ